MTDTHNQIFSGRIKYLFIALLPLTIFLVMGQSLMAQDVNDPQAVTDAQLSALKSADVAEARPGDTIHYTISISNTGDTGASNAMMTDTLPVELDIVPGTLITTIVGGSGSANVVDDVVTWSGSVGGFGGQVQIEFDAILTDTVTVGDLITNTAEITGSGSLLTPSDIIEVAPEVITYTMYMPIIGKPYDPVKLLSVGNPTNNGYWNSYNMLVTWEAADEPGVNYFLEVSSSPDFSNATVYDVGNATSYNVSNINATYSFPLWHFRVRYEKDGVGSTSSNVIAKHGVYSDGFNTSASGWAMRRHDTDDTNDSTYYEDSMFKMKIGGRWDSMIAGPLVALPTTWNGYEIETRVTLEDGVDNLHSYGIVFGADWNGTSPCPDPSFLTCYNSYYRLNVIWTGSTLKAGLKRVDSHDPEDNSDENVTLFDYREIYGEDPNGFNTWNIRVSNNGNIQVRVNGSKIGEVTDTNYVGGGRYFGTFASSNEYSGTAAWYEYYKISPYP